MTQADILMTMQRQATSGGDDDDTDHDPWHVNNDKLESCLPSCFNTSLVFESLGEDMIVVVMKDEMGSGGRGLMTSLKCRQVR